ncbi:hypothetical protein NIES806_23530 [Dolichospermum compactum NIES-806]|uniref:Uncharacterized protein n=1 Tax=Dolichospermum compactum NIES-806 TaxID=1973481 RepID=A0A1Z4V3Y7_9CYAN|nr:hypothetical protein NIES806_23530 [Dolichospermum compactum NIES-806]
MNLPLYSTTLARLADGRETLLSIHLATIVWDNREKVVPILASGFKPLLGTTLMDRLQLVANSVNFRLYGALKPKTISCLGTPASTNSLATPISVPSRSIQILPSLIST